MKWDQSVTFHFRPFQFVHIPCLQRINLILRPFIDWWANSMAPTHAISPHLSAFEWCNGVAAVKKKIPKLRYSLDCRSKTMKLASQYCYDSVFPSVTRNFSDEYLDDDTWSAINEIAPAFNDTFVYCKLFNRMMDCDKLFVPRTTERGLCYSFNTLNVYEMFTNE